MTQNGTLGTPTRPTRIDTELLALLSGDATSLVGLGIDARDTDDGVVVFSGDTGTWTGDAVVWINGTGYPVQSAEWVDSTGSARPVTEWHLGPRSQVSTPSSAIHQLPLDAGSGTSIEDSIGTLTGTLTGTSWTTGPYQGGTAPEWTASGEFGDVPSLSFGGVSNSAWAVTIKSDITQEGVVWQVPTAGGSVHRLRALGTNSPPALSAFIHGRTNNDNGTPTDTDTVALDGELHRAIVNTTGDGGSTDVEIHVDDEQRAREVIAHGALSSPVGAYDADGTLALGYDARSDDTHFDGVIDNWILYDSTLSETDIRADYAAQPWTPDGVEVRLPPQNTRVQPGGTLSLSADLRNLQGSVATQTIELEIGGVGVVDSTSQTLNELDKASTSLTWSVPSGQTDQDYTATVASNDDSASQTVTVNSVGIDDFESYSTGSVPSAYNAVNTTSDTGVVTTSANSGSQSLDLNSSFGDSGFLPCITNSFTGEQPPSIQVAYYEISGTRGGAVRWLDSNGEELMSVGSGNPQVQVVHGAGASTTELTGSPSPDYQTWRRFTLTLDFGAGTFDVLWEDIGGSSSDESASGLSFVGSPSDVGEIQFGADLRPSASMRATGTFLVDDTSSL